MKELENKYIELLLGMCLNFERNKSLFISYDKINKDFVEQIIKRAKELGMKNTNFVNTTGFDDVNHYSSPQDMAKLARELMLKYEKEVTKYSSLKESFIREDTSEPFWLVNTNRLLGDYIGLDGLKTGVLM